MSMFETCSLSKKMQNYIEAHAAKLSLGYAEYLLSLDEFIEQSYIFNEASNQKCIFDVHYNCRSQTEFSKLNTMYALYEAIYKDEDTYYDFVRKAELVRINCNNYSMLSYTCRSIFDVDKFGKNGVLVKGEQVSTADFYYVIGQLIGKSERKISKIPLRLDVHLYYHLGKKIKHIELALGEAMQLLAEAHTLFISWVHSIPTDTLLQNDNGISELAISRERRLMTTDLRAKILSRDKCMCQICGSHEDLQVDHIVPVSRGGKTVDWNLVTLCRKCNMDKSNKIKLLDVS